jgi:hypothetical protein
LEEVAEVVLADHQEVVSEAAAEDSVEDSAEADSLAEVLAVTGKRLICKKRVQFGLSFVFCSNK